MVLEDTQEVKAPFDTSDDTTRPPGMGRGEADLGNEDGADARWRRLRDALADEGLTPRPLAGVASIAVILIACIVVGCIIEQAGWVLLALAPSTALFVAMALWHAGRRAPAVLAKMWSLMYFAVLAEGMGLLFAFVVMCVFVLLPLISFFPLLLEYLQSICWMVVAALIVVLTMVILPALQFVMIQFLADIYKRSLSIHVPSRPHLAVVGDHSVRIDSALAMGAYMGACMGATATAVKLATTLIMGGAHPKASLVLGVALALNFDAGVISLAAMWMTFSYAVTGRWQAGWPGAHLYFGFYLLFNFCTLVLDASLPPVVLMLGPFFYYGFGDWQSSVTLSFSAFWFLLGVVIVYYYRHLALKHFASLADAHYQLLAVPHPGTVPPSPAHVRHMLQTAGSVQGDEDDEEEIAVGTWQPREFEDAATEEPLVR